MSASSDTQTSYLMKYLDVNQVLVCRKKILSGQLIILYVHSHFEDEAKSFHGLSGKLDLITPNNREKRHYSASSFPGCLCKCKGISWCQTMENQDQVKMSAWKKTLPLIKVWVYPFVKCEELHESHSYEGKFFPHSLSARRAFLSISDP